VKLGHAKFQSSIARGTYIFKWGSMDRNRKFNGKLAISETVRDRAWVAIDHQ